MVRLIVDKLYINCSRIKKSHRGCLAPTRPPTHSMIKGEKKRETIFGYLNDCITNVHLTKVVLYDRRLKSLGCSVKKDNNVRMIIERGKEGFDLLAI